MATITREEDVDMLDPDDRAEALEEVSKLVIQAIQRDKGLLIRE
jgi:hypothetical protein